MSTSLAEIARLRPVFLGYRLKALKPAHGAPDFKGVRDICSVSNCIRGEPEDSVQSWDGCNAASCYNSIADALRTLPGHDPSTFEVFAYRLVPRLYRKGTPSPAFDFGAVLGCDVSELPEGPGAGFESLGYDVVSLTPYRPATRQVAPCMASLGHSPLSCNAMAGEIDVNDFCLLADDAGAAAVAARFSLEEPEPGPFVVVEVLRQARTSDRREPGSAGSGSARRRRRSHPRGA